MHYKPFQFNAADGVRVFVHAWLPHDKSVRAAILIVHGAAEHGERYAGVAEFLVGAGFAVFVPDHRGHGKTAGALQSAGDAGPDGFNGILRDLKQLTDIICDRHSLPLFLLGHSMGATLSQRFIQLHGEILRGVVLSGSPGLRPNLEQAAMATAKFAEGDAADKVSTAFQQVFASYNEGFEPNVTGFEWLSRDAAEVRKYVDDPWCGFPFTNRLVAQMSQCALESAHKDNLERVPKSLPILFLSGSDDRVGGNGDYVDKLAVLYRNVGITDLTVKFYAKGRHEMFNEINRDEVHRDVVAWLLGRL